MNKAHLIEAVADKLGGRQQAADAVEAVLDTIVRAVVAGEHVSVTGFGSFERIERAAHWARNPQTGERVRVKKSHRPRFKPGQGFKDLVTGAKKLPRDGESAVQKAPKGSRQAAATKAAARKTAGKKAAATRAANKATARTATTKAPANTAAQKAPARTAAVKASVSKATTQAPASAAAEQTAPSLSPEREAARKAARAAAEKRKEAAKAALKEMPPTKQTPAKKTTRTRSA